MMARRVRPRTGDDLRAANAVLRQRDERMSRPRPRVQPLQTRRPAPSHSSPDYFVPPPTSYQAPRSPSPSPPPPPARKPAAKPAARKPNPPRAAKPSSKPYRRRARPSPLPISRRRSPRRSPQPTSPRPSSSAKPPQQTAAEAREAQDPGREAERAAEKKKPRAKVTRSRRGGRPRSPPRTRSSTTPGGQDEARCVPRLFISLRREDETEILLSQVTDSEQTKPPAPYLQAGVRRPIRSTKPTPARSAVLPVRFSPAPAQAHPTSL